MTEDSKLQSAVLAELGWEPSVTAAHIGVSASNGVVTLTGHVASYAEKNAAETAARRVKGVMAIAEEIEVALPFETIRTDEDIAAAVIERLAWDVCVPRDAITVRVENGWVTLTGQVHWFYQKEAAVEDIRRLFGVVGFSDQITIKPRVDNMILRDEITHALHRSWLFDPQTILVGGQDGVIQLSGTVHTPHDRQVAAATAWAAPGVTGVQNDILVV